MYEEIAYGIRDCCPDAWVINYTNPMTVCTRSLYKAFPKIKAFGCCHEVFGTQKILAYMLEELKGIKGVDHHDIHVNVKGINHFTWLDEAKYHEIDLMPLYREFISLEKDGAHFLWADRKIQIHRGRGSSPPFFIYICGMLSLKIILETK
jgi:alpha-galactosidase/6-phospho-beta-glucosidase family protein